MRVFWLRAHDQPFVVWTAVEIEPGYFTAQIPYLEDGEIRMQTHYMSLDTIEQERARGQWVCVKEQE